MSYKKEAEARTQTARVLCGSRRGYESTKIFSLDDLIGVLENINKERRDANLRTTGCIITEGTLIGRTTESGYREGVYYLDFTWSPRVEPIGDVEFFEIVAAYTFELGARLGQERLYVQYQGNTSVYKQNM